MGYSHQEKNDLTGSAMSADVPVQIDHISVNDCIITVCILQQWYSSHFVVNCAHCVETYQSRLCSAAVVCFTFAGS